VSSTNIFVSGSYRQSALANPTIEGILSLSVPEQIRVVGKYAYLTNSSINTFSIIDVTDPAKPIEISTLSSSTALSFIKGLDVSGRYAYVSGLETVQIIDISNPSNPMIVGGVTSTDFSSDSIYVSGNYAYVSGVNSIQVINISNPSSPTIVGAIVSSTALGSVTSLYVSGAYAYISDRSSDSLRIIDISNPINPMIIGSVVSSTALNDPWSVYVSGKYAYLANETDDSLRIVDVSNPTSPTIVGGIKDSSLLNGARSVSVSGKYAYVAARDDNSIRIIDVSSSTNPTIVGGVKSDSLLYGARSVSVSGKYAYTANWSGNSMSVIGLGGIDAPIATIGMLESGSINITENLMVANNTHIGSSLIVGLGGIKSDGGLSIANSDVFLPGLAAPSSTSDMLCLQPDGRVTHQSSNCTVSSARFKHDIVSWDTGLSTVMHLRPVMYKRNYDNVEELGLIAEEVDQVNKLFVIYEPASTSTPRSVDYERLVIPLISAVQSQQQQIDGLLLASIGVNSSTPRTMSEEELLYAANRPLASAMTYLINRLSDGATVIKDFMSERVTAVVGVFERVKTNRLEINGGIQMKDKSTGEVYCVVIDNGEITKIPGECEDSIDSEESELVTPSGYEEDETDQTEEEIVDVIVPEEVEDSSQSIVSSTDSGAVESIAQVEETVADILSDLLSDDSTTTQP